MATDLRGLSEALSTKANLDAAERYQAGLAIGAEYTPQTVKSLDLSEVPKVFFLDTVNPSSIKAGYTILELKRRSAPSIFLRVLQSLEGVVSVESVLAPSDFSRVIPITETMMKSLDGKKLGKTTSAFVQPKSREPLTQKLARFLNPKQGVEMSDTDMMRSYWALILLSLVLVGISAITIWIITL